MSDALTTMDHAKSKAPPEIVWWIVWGSILLGVTVVYAMAAPSTAAAPIPSLKYLPLVPLIGATCLRWFLLPRFPRATAFILFIVGISLAEACGILGTFLVPALKHDYFVLSVAGVAQFYPGLLLRTNA